MTLVFGSTTPAQAQELTFPVVAITFASTTVTPTSSLTEMIINVSAAHHIPPSTLRNMVESESEGNPNAVGDHGCSFGLVQINTCAHPDVTKKEAKDPLFALNYAAKAIANDTAYQWTSCSCAKYAYVSIDGVPLKDADEFVPNSYEPVVGGLALFHYKSGESHVAVITAINGTSLTVKEANYHPCLIDKRVVDMSDPSLIGFWVV